MRVVESQWWIIDLPDEWEADQEGDVITISDEDGVGEIVLTTLQKEQGVVDEAELLEFTQDVESQCGPGEPIQVGELEGIYFSFEEEGDALREWYLRCNDLLLFISYSCDSENRGMDDSAVDAILNTIFIKTDEEVEG